MFVEFYKVIIETSKEKWNVSDAALPTWAMFCFEVLQTWSWTPGLQGFWTPGLQGSRLPGLQCISAPGHSWCWAAIIRLGRFRMFIFSGRIMEAVGHDASHMVTVTVFPTVIGHSHIDWMFFRFFCSFHHIMGGVTPGWDILDEATVVSWCTSVKEGASPPAVLLFLSNRVE